MRKPNRPSYHNEESLKSIKSTDSKKLFGLKNKIIMGADKSEGSQDEDDSNNQHHMEEREVKNNRKITEYFTFNLSAKTT